MADAGDLEKLPVEFRNEIHSLALVRSEPLTLVTFGGDQKNIGKPIGPQRMKLDNEWARSDKAKVAPKGHQRRPKSIGYQPNGRNKWRKVTSNVALLCVNKHVYAEAVPILYGRTRFRFANPVTVRRFLNLIGDKQQYLRIVGIDGVVRGWRYGHGYFQARYAMEALAAAKGIRTFEIAHPAVCPTRSDAGNALSCHEVVKICEPLLNSLKTAYQENNLNKDLLEVLKIIHSASWGLWGCNCSLESFQRMLKREVSERHELALE